MDPEPVDFCPSGTALEPGLGSTDITQVQFSGVDILVVMDNSSYMAEEQALLAEAFPSLIRSLIDPPDSDGDTLPDHIPVKDVHIGVVSTDMGSGGFTVETCSDPIDGDDGVLQHTPNPLIGDCAVTYPTYLSYSSDTVDEPLIEDMVTGFGCIVTLGTNGCGFEQQLEAGYRALEHTHPVGPNAGFLRSESVLAVLFVTDEEDCSAADGHIFDTADSTLGHLPLRCYLHPDMVHPVDRYIDALREHRDDPEKLVMSFIVGVPQDPQCEGAGDAIDGCLEHPDMIEQIDPMDPTRLRTSCISDDSYAFPARRFVQVAQAFGASAQVSSICNDDYQPAVDGFADRIQGAVDDLFEPKVLNTVNAQDDPCRCEATCFMVQMFPDMRPCPDNQPCWDPGGDGCDTETPDGYGPYSLCEIPQAGTVMTPCDPENPPDCTNPAVTHAVDGQGWYYVGWGWTLDGAPPTPISYIELTDGWEFEPGATVWLPCCS